MISQTIVNAARTTQLNDTILALLMPGPAEGLGEKLASLSSEDWCYILDRSREHRLLPLLYHGLEQADALTAAPAEVKSVLHNARHRHTLRALTAQRTILQLHRLLKSAQIGHVFLKGSYLAQFVYPHPSLRPMRDIDVVISPGQIEYAYKLLVDAGYRGPAFGNDFIDAYIQQAKHLPPMRTPDGAFLVELHMHVDQPGGILAGMDPFAHITHRSLGTDAVPFMGLTDLVVHLCVHAASFHSFNNGPLTIADIGYLLTFEDVDLNELAARAAELRVEKPVALTLALVESCWQTRRNDLQASFRPIPSEIVQVARKLCFTNTDQNKNITFMVGMTGEKTALSNLRILASKILPHPRKLALEFGRSTNPGQLVWFYLKRWHRIVAERLPALYRSRKSITFAEEFDDARVLNAWLDNAAYQP